jgi:ABC-type bacteriocin/lantibiotic exporter with double-glycine peptidase domain
VRAASPADTWREARRLLRRSGVPLTEALALLAVGRLAALALPAGSKVAVDEVLGRGRVDLLAPLAILLGSAIVVEAAAAFGAAQAAGTAEQKAAANLRRELLGRVAAWPLGNLAGAQSGGLAARIVSDSEQVRLLVGSGAVQLVASLLTALLAGILLLRLNLVLSLAVLSVVVLSALCTSGAFRRIAIAIEGLLRQQSDLTGALAETIGRIQIIKAYTAEREETHRLARQSHRLARLGVDAVRRISLLSAGGTLASGSLGVLVLVGGAWSVTSGRMSVGSSVMYAWLAAWLLGPVLHLAAAGGELGKAAAALRRIVELRQQLTEEEEDRGKRRLGRVTGTVDFECVSFAYRPNRQVLRDITMHCPAGSTTALIGPNGSGKTTLCRLVLAYHCASQGRILIDGTDLGTVHRRSYRSRLGVVLQDDLLFDGTIADNIGYGRPRTTLAQVEAAGRLAQCDEFVARLRDGYSTRVGERGMALSAGQRQRVAIARAFLADPQILVLDEVTSHLDAESERLIQNALSSLCQGRTTFVIAHRLSTIRNADQIVALDHGHIVERGTPQELLARRGSYFQRHSRPEHPTARPAEIVERRSAFETAIRERATQPVAELRADACAPGSWRAPTCPEQGTDDR